MRTNIVIDDKLMRDTLRATGLKTKREVVDLALQTLLRLVTQDEIRGWRGELDGIRGDA
jgi:Arc/MetJ family transcription regulator